MDRQMVYAGQVPLETDILNTNQNAFLALGKLATALFGANTAVNGFGCTPTAPASLQVNIGAGEVYTVQSVDNSAYSSLPADTSHQITKQGIALDNTTIKITPPTTSGQSINYLVQVAFTETDSGAKVLQYYNSANPAQSFSGAGNSGAVQPTVRQNTCAVGLKSGGAGATGSQTTPAPDAGYVGLWVITVATGQSAITASNISPYPYAPFVNSGLLGLSPAFSVSPTAPTPPLGDTSQKVANMAALQAGLGSLNTAVNTAITNAINNVVGALNTTGYFKLPNGIIVQYFQFTSSSSGYSTALFPIAFPNRPLAITMTANSNTTTAVMPVVNFAGSTSTNLNAACLTTSGAYANFSNSVIAIGY